MNEYTNSTNAGSGRSRSGLVNALLGAVVMTVFSWIPFAPVVGGALSGYLEASERRASTPASRRGIRVGALAGVIATIPAVLVIAFVGSIVTVGWFGMSMGGGMSPRVGLGLPVFAWALALFGLVLALVYHVGLSALGGWLGAEFAAREDRPDRGTPTGDGRTDAEGRRVGDGQAGTGIDHRTQEIADEDAQGADGRDDHEAGARDEHRTDR